VNAVAARPAARLLAVRVALPADAVALVALTAFAGVLLGLCWGTWGDPGKDTGYDVVAGARVAQGDLPYVDFVYYYGPLAPLTLGLASWLGGGGLGPAVGVGIVVTFAIVLATYALARQFVRPAAAWAAAALTAAVAFVPSNLAFVLPHAESETLGMLALLGFLIAIARCTRRRSAGLLLAAGACGGLVSLTRIEFELAFVVAAAVWLALRPGSRLRDGVLLAAPALAVPAVVYGAFLTAVPVHRLFLENLYPVDTLRAAGNAVLRIHAPLTLSSFAALAGKTLLYGCGVALLVAAGLLLERRGAIRRTILGALVALLALAAAVGAARPETLRYWLDYGFMWIPAGAVLLLGFDLRRRRASEAALDATLAVVAATTYAAFQLVADRPQPAVYLVPVAAILLARIHTAELPAARTVGVGWLAFLALASAGLTLRDAHAQSATLRGPGGALAVMPAEAPVYRQALAWIARSTRPGEAILLAPQLTVLYTLADRAEPLPQLSLLPGALPTVRDEERAAARLDAAGVRLVITDRHLYTEYGHTSFGGSFDLPLAAWVERNFDHAATLGGPGSPRTLDVWTRRT
jgi:hypothetical protein